ncbi:MAG: ABC transporter permease subunit [Deltaproteobacteria bacterium]|nr:ABC transporter permease subunit [Deltaproteobacteria bacterium]
MRRFSGAAVMLLGVLRSTSAHADDWDRLQEAKRFTWGGDQEGGGPFIFPREDRPEEVTGFEVDLAVRLGEALGLEAQFQQGNWDKLPDLLRAGKVDLVLNGYEWSAIRAETFEVSVPYFVYALQFMVRTDDPTAAIEDLGAPLAAGRRRRVGVLVGSAAESYLAEHFGDRIEIRSYDGSTDAMREVETGKLDATVQDTPVLAFYGPRFPRLRALGAPVAPGFYVILARKGERALIHRVNTALLELLDRGELERIYRRYGLWDSQQATLASIAAHGRYYGYPTRTPSVSAARPAEAAVQVETRLRGWEVVRRYGPTLLSSAGMTVLLSCISFPLALLAGLLIALGRLYGPRWVALPLTGWVELIRGTPLMLQLYFIFFFLPELGVTFSPIATAVLGLAINYSAYESEIHRAGLQAVPFGQMEAALSIGLSRRQALGHVIIPQAVRVVIPPMVNDFITLFKDTSVCSVVTVIELTKRFSVLAMSTQAVVEMMLMTALLYLLMSYPLSAVARRLEHQLAKGGTR